MVCEKCWNDARSAMLFLGEPIEKAYFRLIEERKDNPCTPKEAAGLYWDSEREVDTREVYDEQD